MRKDISYNIKSGYKKAGMKAKLFQIKKTSRQRVLEEIKRNTS